MKRIVLAVFVGALVSACGGGDSPGTTQPVRVLTSLSISIAPATISIGQTATATVSGIDQTGASIATGTVTFTSASASATVASDGKITGVSQGSSVITATAGGKTTQGTVVVTGPVATGLSLLTPPPTTAANRIAFQTQPVVQLVNASGASVAQSGVVISTSVSLGSVAATTGNSTSATTDATGKATFAGVGLIGTIGLRTMTFLASGLISVSAPVTLTAGPPAFGAIVDGNNQSATAGTAVANAPSVRVVDADGNFVPNLPMTFNVLTGGGSVSGNPASTNSQGVATVGSWTLGPTAGTNTLISFPVGGSGGVTFTATATPAPLACGPSVAIAIDETRAGVLAPNACVIGPPANYETSKAAFTGPVAGGSYFYDLYNVDVPAGTTVRFDVANGASLMVANIFRQNGDYVTYSTAATPGSVTNSTAATVRYQIVIANVNPATGGAYSITPKRP